MSIENCIESHGIATAEIEQIPIIQDMEFRRFGIKIDMDCALKYFKAKRFSFIRNLKNLKITVKMMTILFNNLMPF
jgi:hypothetical protein